MDKKNQKLVDEAVEKVRVNFEQKAAEFERQSKAKLKGGGAFSIDTLERLLGETLAMNAPVAQDLFEKMNNGIGDEELLKKKRPS